MALVLSLLIAFASAVEIEKVNFPGEMDVAGKKLVLNGFGKRVKKKFGMNFDVYVAGLYVPTKSGKASELIASDDVKVLRLVFLRSLDKSTLREAWEESYDKNCKFDCEASKAGLKAFNDLMVDVKDKSEMRLEFGKDGVSIEMNGKEKKSGKVAGEGFRKNLMSVFIGDEPPTEDLKKGLLGS
jgi:hypothetical protein